MADFPLPFALGETLPSSPPPTLINATYSAGLTTLALSFDVPMALASPPPAGSLIVRTAGFNATEWTIVSVVGATITLMLFNAGAPSGPVGTGTWTQPGGSIRSAAGVDWASQASFPVTIV